MLNDFKCDECGRLMALSRLNVLDSAEEQPFENIVTLVQQTLGVPICAVSLIDENRQWFKARRGLNVCETPRNISFCTHTIRGTAPFVICDATMDARFADNPLVTGEPHIRSYAGIPLMTPDGYNIGSLCAIDTKSRNFTEAEICILENFAKVVIDELELRQIASTDQLTGAMSRRAWVEVANNEALRASRYQRPLSLLILDIDHFKRVNDQFGHPAGDTVIKRVAQIAMEQLRDSDAFGRFGGEEFVAVLTETAYADALQLADRIRQSVKQEYFTELDDLRCTVSIGVADFQPSEQISDPVLERADRALFKAKAAGRDQVQGATGTRSLFFSHG